MIRGTRGVSVGGLLALAAVLVVLAAGLARLVVVNLHLEARSQAGFRALNLARTATAETVAKILDQQAFGAERLDSDTVLFEDSRGTAAVTFSPSRALTLGLPCSTNALKSNAAVLDPDGLSVAAGTVRLMSIGRSGGVERRIEAVIEIPQFPWAVAAAGRVTTETGVLVGCLPEGMWPPVLEELLPADILSNDSGAEAVTLGPNTTVLGDVEAVGSVILSSPTASVAGLVCEQMQPNDLPVLAARDYDPTTQGLTADNLDDLIPGAEPLRVIGAARRTGHLALPAGLHLEQANLFVDGNLTVDGKMDGEGMVVVTGDLTINTTANMDGANNLALLADGRVTLSGQGPGASKLRGIVYGGQGLRATRLTLVGSLVAARPGAAVSLADTVVVAERLPPPELAKEFFIGTLDPTNPRYHDESVSATVPSSGSLLRLKVSRQQPETEYPIEVEFQYRGNTPYIYTIANAADTDRVQELLEWLVDDWTQIPRDAWVETIFDRFPLGGFTSQIAPAEPGHDFPTDLSLLIPAKDRIRVLTWFER